MLFWNLIVISLAETWASTTWVEKFQAALVTCQKQITCMDANIFYVLVARFHRPGCTTWIRRMSACVKWDTVFLNCCQCNICVRMLDEFVIAILMLPYCEQLITGLIFVIFVFLSFLTRNSLSGPVPDWILKSSKSV